MHIVIVAEQSRLKAMLLKEWQEGIFCLKLILKKVVTSKLKKSRSLKSEKGFIPQALYHRFNIYIRKVKWYNGFRIEKHEREVEYG
jgi:hypothetical protein